ncbi:MAG TPA: N-acetylmuramic acid 6-phosphate etherase [Ktedonobacterales bacterium]|nr:N-acetylmuramic acid 6-phosphate etherase [Ktedonobacterales bacterium]
MPQDAGNPRPDTPITEQRNPATAEIDRMNPLEIAQAMNAEDARVAEAVRRELPQVAAAMQVIAERLRSDGRLIYLGAGTSGRLGALDAIECHPTFNIPADRIVACVAGGADALAGATEVAEDDAALGRADIERLAVVPQDVVVGISASGSTPYTLGGVAAAREQGAYTIGLACNAGSALERLVNIMIAPRVGPEVIAGSTRLKAGAAQKMVLNMLSTGAMVLLGKTYGNLMVDVQASNDKLRARARAIVESATGLEAEQATALLRQADGDTKVAILIGRTGLAPAAARARLAAHNGNLRRALEDE